MACVLVDHRVCDSDVGLGRLALSSDQIDLVLSSHRRLQGGAESLEGVSHCFDVLDRDESKRILRNSMSKEVDQVTISAEVLF